MSREMKKTYRFMLALAGASGGVFGAALAILSIR